MLLLRLPVSKIVPGFTLMEIIVAMAIAAILFSIGLPMTLSLLRSYSLKSERDILVSLLEQARDQSLGNVQEANHGLAVTAANYVVFQGDSYAARDLIKDLTYPRAAAVAISGPSEINFQSITDANPGGTFILNANQVQTTVSVNKEGMIDW